jgi:hypothetical protein
MRRIRVPGGPHVWWDWCRTLENPNIPRTPADVAAKRVRHDLRRSVLGTLIQREAQHTSVSSTSLVAACAVGPGPLGVDIERLQAVPEVEMLARRLHPSEARILSAVRGAERVAAFLALWTAKESVAKATELGLDDVLSSVPFTTISDAPRSWQLVSPPADGHWRVVGFALPFHVGSVCWRD